MAKTRLYQGFHHALVELDRQIHEGEYPNCNTFSKKWECSRKTVLRYINYLKDSLGAPIGYDYFRKGYYYTDPTWTMPGLKLTEGELFILLTAERMAEQYSGTPLGETLRTLFEKILTALPDEITFDPTYFKSQKVSFFGHPTREISQKVWIALFKALRGNEVIRIIYSKVGSVEPDEREVEPLHLACIDGEWYLIAFCRMREDIRHFAVSRINSVKQTGKKVQPRKFDAREYFKNRFSRYIGEPGKNYNIKIRFSKDAAMWITERVWHPKQKVHIHKDGSVTLSFPAPALYEVKRWVLQWGADAKVLAPKELQRAIGEEISSIAKKYLK